MTLEQRLERLERQNRWMRRIGAVGIAAVAVVMLVGQGQAAEPGDLRVRSLVLVDGDGKTRASLGIVDTDAVKLEFIGRKGGSRFEVYTSPRSAWLCCYGPKGDANVQLGFDLRTSSLILTGVDGKRSAYLQVDPAVPLIGLTDDKRDMLLSYKNGPDGPGPLGLEIRDNGAGGRVTFGLEDKGPSLSLSDADGKVIWKAPGE